MAKYLINYSTYYRAKEKNFPPSGSEVTISTLEELHAFQERMGSPLIIHEAGWVPSWCDYHYLESAEDLQDDHKVAVLPENWKDSKWIEVYNGYRE